MILILGATSDMAQAIAQRYAKEGHEIILAGRSIDRLSALQSDLRIRHEIKAYVASFDAQAIDSHANFYKNLPSRPDLVFCVFGKLNEQVSAEQNWSLAHEMLNVNYSGAVSILHHVANDFEQRKAGAIVGISSVAGERGRASNYYYGSAKAGFTAFLSGLRNRLSKSNVHVLTVKPGYVQTAMTEGMDLPGPLTAQPAEVANAIYQAVQKKKNVLYVKPIWRWIMWIIRNVPEGIFKKMSL